MKRVWGLLFVSVLALAAMLATVGSAWADNKPKDIDPNSLIEGPAGIGVETGTSHGPQTGSVTLSGTPADYDWWNGCSPTAAGMLFGYWEEHGHDAFPGNHRNLPATYPGTSTTQSDYNDARGIIASWAHKQSGVSQGLTYGSYRSHAPNCIADFLRTDNSSTSRGDMAHGLETFAAWDDRRTPVNESRRFTATTSYVSSGWSFANYCAEIDAGRPVHLGLSGTDSKGNYVGHSVLGVGYNNTGGKQDVILLTTWHWGLQEWQWSNEPYSGYDFSVYAGTMLQPSTTPTPHLSAYFSIAHTYIGDLTVTLGTGDPAHPDWSTVAWNRGGTSADNLVLTDIDCSAVESQFVGHDLTWFLKVTDSKTGDTGTIEDFQIRWGPGDSVFDYSGPPVAILDNQTEYVYLATPEPGTLTLLALGCAAWVVRRRARR